MAHDPRVRRLFLILAQRRAAGVGLALLVEILALIGLAVADPSAVLGVPAAVVAAIGGTVAVVFGPVDGAFVALAGAVVFGFAVGWEPGAVAALALWPAIVAAAGLFARRVAEQRRALGRSVAGHERELQRIALTLHEDTAQRLAGALLLLRQAERSASPAEAAAAQNDVRTLMADTITSVRQMAVELRPKALDDFGLVAALERLAADSTHDGSDAVTLRADAHAERLSADVELVLFRIAQETLAAVRQQGDGTARITLERSSAQAAVSIEYEGNGLGLNGQADATGLATLLDRVRLIGGRMTITSRPGGGSDVRAEIPV